MRKKKQKMHKEVLYAKKTSSIPNDAVFRLKKNHKNLSTLKYAINLKSYIDSNRSSKSITISDLHNVLYGLVTNSENKMKQQLDHVTQDTNVPACNSVSFSVGEHVDCILEQG